MRHDFENVQVSMEEIVVNDDTEKYLTNFEDLYYKHVAIYEIKIFNNTKNH